MTILFNTYLGGSDEILAVVSGKKHCKAVFRNTFCILWITTDIEEDLLLVLSI